MRQVVSFLLLALSSLNVNCLDEYQYYQENTINDDTGNHFVVDSRQAFNQKKKNTNMNLQKVETTQTPIEAYISTESSTLILDVTQAIDFVADAGNDTNSTQPDVMPIFNDNFVSSQQLATIQLLTQRLIELFKELSKQNNVQSQMSDVMMDAKNPPNRGPNQLPQISLIQRNAKKLENSIDTWSFLTSISKVVEIFGKSNNNGCHKLAICLATDALNNIVDLTKDTDGNISSYLSTISVMSEGLLNKDATEKGIPYEKDCRKRFSKECEEANHI